MLPTCRCDPNSMNLWISCLTWQKGLCRCEQGKHREVGRVSWIICMDLLQLRGRQNCDDRSRGERGRDEGQGRERLRLEDGTLLALKVEEGASSLSVGKDKETDSSLKPPEIMQPCWLLDFKNHWRLLTSQTVLFKPLHLWKFVPTAIQN